MTTIIDEVKSYLESEAGGQWLLMAISGAKTRENQKRYFHYEEPVYSREKEDEKRRQAMIREMETPIPLSCNRSDMENLIQFNQTHSDEHIMALVSDDTVKFIQRSPGHSIPNMPILQSGYFPVIVRDGTGRVYDNRKQAYQISLID